MKINISRGLLMGAVISCLVAACGGGDSTGPVIPSRIVSFGDSLSDVGTYAVSGNPPVGPLAFGGGRYTTNPGQVWTEIVANRYGVTLTPAVKTGFGSTTIAAGGYGYAQGGARVTTDLPPDAYGISAMPVRRQIETYIVRAGRFAPTDLVLLQGGANDIVNGVLAAAGGTIDPAAVPALVTTAASDLARAVDRIVAAGGQKIVLQNMVDIGLTPLATDYPDVAQNLSAMSRLFNETLQRELAIQAKPEYFILVDAYGWTNDIFRNPVQSGFKVTNRAVACSTDRIISQAFFIGIPDPLLFLRENGSALLCSATTLTEAGADQTYMFADALHPSSRMHSLFAAHVQSRLAAKGI